MLFDKLKGDNFQLNISAALLEMNGVDEADKEMLRKEAPFTYTYLIFDFDPQHSNKPIEYNLEIVSDMVARFDNETDDTVGKLYINYPMVESLWDYDKNNPDEYAARIVPLQSIKDYKEIVGRRGSPRNPSKYDLKYYMFLALLNIKKANSIINGNWRKPSYSIYTSEITQEAIVAAEGNAAIAENNVYVLNSLPLFMVDYWGKSFYDSIA